MLVVYFGISPDEERALLALRAVDRAWLRRRFDAIDDRTYRGAQDDQDFEYTWTNFADVRSFYDRAAANGQVVLFTAT
ncbi:DUF1877 family protein [Micromonosporaceae bacterium Da 78-11]